MNEANCITAAIAVCAMTLIVASQCFTEMAF